MTAEPPPLARLALTLALPRDERDAVLGDLEEEYAVRAHATGPDAGNAAGWYWRQALSSIPSLALHRLRGREGVQLLFFSAAGLLAYLATTVWDAAIARRLVQTAGAAFSSPPIVALRVFYLLAQAAGFALTGAIIAAVMRTTNIASPRAAPVLLLGVAAVLAAPTLWAMLSGQDAYPLWFRLAWLTLTLPSFFGAACWVLMRGKRR